ncbi:hypothetical protein Ms3S1_01600 [Methylosinus sp. 3S-1]
MKGDVRGALRLRALARQRDHIRAGVERRDLGAALRRDAGERSGPATRVENRVAAPNMRVDEPAPYAQPLAKGRRMAIAVRKARAEAIMPADRVRRSAHCRRSRMRLSINCINPFTGRSASRAPT